MSLAAHEAQVARDLALLLLPPPNWPAVVFGPDGKPVLDVLVVGAGMYGIAAAAALGFKGLRNIQVIDRALEGQEGPWITTARMTTLRSPKHLPGIPLGIPSLTFRAWFEAKYSADFWEGLYKISNGDWQDYLLWVRRVLALPVQNGVELLRVVAAGALLAVTLREAGTERVSYVRRLVFASGRDGIGGFIRPDNVAADLWPDLAAHSGEVIDFTRLAGRTVAVLGAGPSAWDNAATALEQGAERVDMYVRRTVLPQVNKGRGSANPGFFEGWATLPPAEKWRILAYMHDVQSPPPHESIDRALALPGFHIHLGTLVLDAKRDGGRVRLHLPAGTASADFLILGTGFAVDIATMPELAALAPRIARWADRYTPPPGLARAELARFPWLGEGFELTAKPGASAEGLDRIHLFSHAAFASLGAIASDVPGASSGAERLAHHIAAQVFAEDIATIRARLEAFAEPELEGTPFFALPAAPGPA